MDDLIERLEKLEGPDRLLDADIYALTQSNPAFLGYLVPRVCSNGEVWEYGENNSLHVAIAPAYTASIDAALTLVPDGFSAHLSILPTGAGARVGFQKEESVSYASPAIALCIAALKARKQSEGQPND